MSENEGKPAQTNFPPTEKDAMIPNQHVVFFSNDTQVDEVEEKAAEVARQTGGKILWIYKHLKGVALSGGTGVQRRTLLDSALLRDSVESFEQVGTSCVISPFLARERIRVMIFLTTPVSTPPFLLGSNHGSR